MVSAGGRGPLPPRAGSASSAPPHHHSPRLDARARPPPAVPGSRGDGRRLTRGAEAARRGLDHWAAEGAARRAGPARPGPLMCFYYPQETKLPGTDARAPSFLGRPHHTLTSAPPALSPQTCRAPSRPPAPRPRAPRVNVPLASCSRPDLDQRREECGLGRPVINCLSGERKWPKQRNTRGREGQPRLRGQQKGGAGRSHPAPRCKRPSGDLRCTFYRYFANWLFTAVCEKNFVDY